MAFVMFDPMFHQDDKLLLKGELGFTVLVVMDVIMFMVVVVFVIMVVVVMVVVAHNLLHSGIV